MHGWMFADNPAGDVGKFAIYISEDGGSFISTFCLCFYATDMPRLRTQLIHANG